jgi:dUTP pyrophosphatase
MTRVMINDNVYFAKVKESAIIPTKSGEDMGYDVYACFEEEEIVIDPHCTIMIPTGIASACTPKYGFLLQERGSTGTKGMAQRCGVIDSGYRNEWFVPITNTTDHRIIISKCKTRSPEMLMGDILYPYTKAICQAILVEVPVVNVSELSYTDLKAIDSERKLGKLGSSNK